MKQKRVLDLLNTTRNNFTVADSRYLDFVARGLVWAVKREDAPIKKADK